MKLKALAICLLAVLVIAPTGVKSEPVDPSQEFLITKPKYFFSDLVKLLGKSNADAEFNSFLKKNKVKWHKWSPFYCTKSLDLILHPPEGGDENSPIESVMIPASNEVILPWGISFGMTISDVRGIADAREDISVHKLFEESIFLNGEIYGTEIVFYYTVRSTGSASVSLKE